MFTNKVEVDGVLHEIEWTTIQTDPSKFTRGKVKLGLKGPMFHVLMVPIWFWWARIPYILKLSTGHTIRRVTAEEAESNE